MQPGELRNLFFDASQKMNEVQIPETLKLRLYALSKQAKEGDCKMPQPPSSNTILRSKWEAWMGCTGMTMERAMSDFVDIIEKLEPAVRAPVDRQPSRRSLLVSPAISTGAVKKGVLYKQRDVFKGWRPRHFVLQDNFLHYYIEPDDPVPRNSLDLTGCSVSTNKSTTVDNVEYFPFVISHPKSKLSYTLSSDSKLEADIWIAKIIDAANLPVAAGSRESTDVSSPSPLLAQQASRTSSVTFATSTTPSKTAPTTASDEVSTGEGFFVEGTAYPQDTRIDTPSHIVQKIEKNVQQLLETAPSDAPGWDFLWVKDGLTARKKQSPSLIWVKAEIALPFCLMDVFKYIIDLKNQKELDPPRLLHERIKVFSNHTWVDYLRYKGIWPTSPRDFVNIAHWRLLQDGRAIVLGYSEPFDDLRPPYEGHVRADMQMGGYLLTPTPTGTLINYLVKLDLKGSIPSTVVNLVSNSQPMILLTMRQLMIKARDNRGEFQTAVTEKATYSEVVTFVSDQLFKSTGGNALAGASSAPGAVDNASKVATTNVTAASAAVSASKQQQRIIPTAIRGSSLLKMATKVPHINNAALTIVLLPAFLYYVSAESNFRAAAFLAGLLVAVNYLLQLHLGKASSKSSPQLHLQMPTSKLLFRFPIELTNLLSYIESKRNASEIDVTFSHIAVKAAAMILHEMPGLNGHIVSHSFYKHKSAGVDISLSMDVHEGQTVVFKVADADAKSIEYIADEVINSSRTLRSGLASQVNPIVKRLQQFAPALIGAPIRRQLYRLGAQYGLSIPFLGISPFPQGVCTIISSPTVDNEVDVDIAIVPDLSDSAAPITVTMGGLRVMPGLDEKGKTTGSRVLNFSLAISSTAASLAEARRFCSRFQQLMNDPQQLDKLHDKAEFDRVEAAKRRFAFGNGK